jgi:hypothetical protein
MGRITLSFRQIFQNTIFQLYKKNGFYHSLKHPGHQRAFISLVKTLSSEYAAMWNSGIFCIEDIMNLMANIHVRACINQLEVDIARLEHLLQYTGEQIFPSTFRSHSNE